MYGGGGGGAAAEAAAHPGGAGGSGVVVIQVIYASPTPLPAVVAAGGAPSAWWSAAGGVDIAAGTWRDASGFGRTATLYGSGFATGSTTGAGAVQAVPFLSGVPTGKQGGCNLVQAPGDALFAQPSTVSVVKFGDYALPASYTVCSLMRTTVANTGDLILQALYSNWAHGLWGTSTGFAYYGGVYKSSGSNLGTDWSFLCAHNGPTAAAFTNTASSLGSWASVGTNPGGSSGGIMTINSGWCPKDATNWAVSHLLVWPRLLSTSEMAAMMDWFDSQLYAPAATAPPPPPPWQGALCSFNEAHRVLPNPYGYIASGTNFSAQPVLDTGSAATKYTITAAGGVTYDGTALAFDGVSGVVSFGAPRFGGSPFSMSLWVKYTAFNSWSRVLDFAPAVSTFSLALSNVDATGQIGLAVGGAKGYPSPATWTLNTWSHFVLACTPPSTCAVYVNGALQTFSFQSAPAMVDQTFSYTAGFGKSAYSHDGWFAGSVSDFRFFNRALTSTEATALYSGAACAPPPAPPALPAPSPPPPPPPASCAAILSANPAASSGPYSILTPSGVTATVMCDMTGGGWTKVFNFPGGFSDQPDPTVTTEVRTDAMTDITVLSKLSDDDITAMSGDPRGFRVKCKTKSDNSLRLDVFMTNSEGRWDSRPAWDSGLSWQADINSDGTPDCAAVRSDVGFTFSTYGQEQQSLTTLCDEGYKNELHFNWGGLGSVSGCFVSPDQVWNLNVGEVWLGAFPSPPPPPSPPPWQGALCSFNDAHRILPNPYGAIASGTAFSAQPVLDTGSAATKYTITATGGVTYDGTALAFDGVSGAVSLGTTRFGGSAFSMSLWVKYTAFNSCACPEMDIAACLRACQRAPACAPR
jgi:hypothetical protein